MKLHKVVLVPVQDQDDQLKIQKNISLNFQVTFSNDEQQVIDNDHHIQMNDIFRR